MNRQIPSVFPIFPDFPVAAGLTAVGGRTLQHVFSETTTRGGSSRTLRKPDLKKLIGDFKVVRFVTMDLRKFLSGALVRGKQHRIAHAQVPREQHNIQGIVRGNLRASPGNASDFGKFAFNPQSTRP